MSQQDKDDTTFTRIVDRFGPGLVSWEIYARNLRHALFDTRGVLKNVPVHFLWGAMSPWNCAWTAKCLTDMLKEPTKDGETRREIHIERIDDMNHFVSLMIMLYVLLVSCRSDNDWCPYVLLGTL